MVNATVTLAFKVVKLKANTGIGFVKLLCAVPRVPMRLEAGQTGVNFIKTDAIRALVRLATGGVFDMAAGDSLLDNGGEVAHLIILVIAPDIKRLIMNALARRLQHSDKRTDDVLDMDDRPPWGAVALDVNLPGSDRPRNEVVQHQIEAHPGRYAVGGGVTQKDRAEVVGCQRGDAGLGQTFAFAVGRNRVEGGVFIQHRVARRAVGAARGREQKTRDSCLACHFRQMHRPAMIDLIGQVGVEVAKGVVGERGQMQHRVEAVQVGSSDVADVLTHSGDVRGFFAEQAVMKKAAVQPDDLVTFALKHGNHDSADVPIVSGH